MSINPLPKIQVDWNDDYGQLRIGLDCNIAKMNIKEQGLNLKSGMRVHLTGDELEGAGGRKIWIAKVVDGTLKNVVRNPIKPGS